jgi:hypothetical protein
MKQKYDLALCVQVEGYPHPVCLCCAEEIANKSCSPDLFWMVHKPITCPFSLRCQCGKQMGEEECESSAARIKNIIDE